MLRRRILASNIGRQCAGTWGLTRVIVLCSKFKLRGWVSSLFSYLDIQLGVVVLVVVVVVVVVLVVAVGVVVVVVVVV